MIKGKKDQMKSFWSKKEIMNEMIKMITMKQVKKLIN